MATPKRYSHGWQIATWYLGRRIRKRFPDNDHDGANGALAAANAFLASLLGTGPAPAVDGSLRDSLRDFLHWSELDKKKAAKWCQSLAQMCGEFVEFLEGQRIRSPRQIRSEHVRAYRRWFATTTGRSDATWEKYRSGIAAWLNWAGKRDPLIKNPATDDEFIVAWQKHAPETFEREEVRQILQFADSLENPLITLGFRLLFYAGLRLGEMVALTWDDVNLTARTIKVGTKTKRERTIPIAAAVLPYLKPDIPLPSRVSHKQWYTLLQRACITMGIKRRPLHATRHTCARFLLEGGTPLVTVSQFLGHLDIRTTMIYAQHFNLNLARNGVDQLNF